MIFNIELVGDELTELMDIVAAENKEFPGRVPLLTPEQFMINVCTNYLSQRVRELYVFEARTADISDLKGKLGGMKSLKNKHKKVK